MGRAQTYFAVHPARWPRSLDVGKGQVSTVRRARFHMRSGKSGGGNDTHDVNCLIRTQFKFVWWSTAETKHVFTPSFDDRVLTTSIYSQCTVSPLCSR